MKYIILISFLTISSISFAQKKEILSEIITINNDTIKSKIIVVVHLFDNTLINELSVTKTVHVMNNQNIKNKISAKKIKKLTFIDFKNNERIFINDGNKLKEVIYEGLIKCYITYSSNAYNSILGSIDFYDETGKRVIVGPFSSSTDALKKAVKKDPELVTMIDKSELSHHKTIKLVLQKYDQVHLKNNVNQ